DEPDRGKRAWSEGRDTVAGCLKRTIVGGIAAVVHILEARAAAARNLDLVVRHGDAAEGDRPAEAGDLDRCPPDMPSRAGAVLRIAIERDPIVRDGHVAR